MTTYAWPFRAQDFEATLVPNVRSFASPYSGSSQVVDLLGERWRFIVTLPGCKPDEAAAREAFFNRLLGGAHKVAMHHLMRPHPRGTLRGSPTLSAAVAQGAASLPLAFTGAATLRAGDMLGVSGQLFQVAEDAGGTNSMTVQIVNRARVALGSGAPVVWDKPAVACICPHVPTLYTPGLAQPQMIDFTEAP